MKGLGEVSECLGMRVTRDRINGITKLDQEHYARDVIERFGMSDCRTRITPMDVSQKLSKPSTENGSDLFQKIMGALMYLAVCTRADISHAVGFLSQFNNCNGQEHLNAARRVIAYLKGTVSYGLCFKKGDGVLTGLADADYANCLDDRASFTGYVFKLNNGVISWRSAKQRTLTLPDSTTYAEYVALSECGKEGIFLLGLLNKLGFSQKTAVIFNDNQGAIKISNGATSAVSTSMYVKYHQLKRWVSKGVFDIKYRYLSSDKMLADVFTKALDGTKHRYCIQGIGIVG